MKVLVTGAGGKIGSRVAAHLRSVGHEVRATDRPVAKNMTPDCVPADLLNLEDCRRLLEGMEALVHLANHPGPHAGAEDMILRENLTMNANMFTAAMAQGLSKIVFSSSIQVIIGNRRTEDHPLPDSGLSYFPLDGDSPPNCGNTYALSKKLSEEMLRFYDRHGAHKTQVVVVRFPAILLMEWSTGLLKRWRELPPKYLLDEAFTYLALPDAATFIAAVLAADLPGYRCYMPTADDVWSDQAVPELIHRHFPHVPLRGDPAKWRSLSDTGRITRETGWRPAITFAQIKAHAAAHPNESQAFLQRNAARPSGG